MHSSILFIHSCHCLGHSFGHAFIHPFILSFSLHSFINSLVIRLTLIHSFSNGCSHLFNTAFILSIFIMLYNITVFVLYCVVLFSVAHWHSFQNLEVHMRQYGRTSMQLPIVIPTENDRNFIPHLIYKDIY